jgi:hypothetical protein
MLAHPETITIEAANEASTIRYFENDNGIPPQGIESTTECRPGRCYEARLRSVKRGGDDPLRTDPVSGRLSGCRDTGASDVPSRSAPGARLSSWCGGHGAVGV